MKNIAYLFVVVALSTGGALAQNSSATKPKSQIPSSYIPQSKAGTDNKTTLFLNVLTSQLKESFPTCTIELVGKPDYHPNRKTTQSTFINNGKPTAPITSVCPYNEWFTVKFTKSNCSGSKSSDSPAMELSWRADALTDKPNVCEVSKSVNDARADSKQYEKSDINLCCNIMYYMDLANVTEDNREITWALEKAQVPSSWEVPPSYGQ